MKRLLIPLLILLILGCGRSFTGLGSVDLQVSSITFHDSHPATITGILPSGKPAQFAAAADSPLIEGMKLICTVQQDTSGIEQVNRMADYPISCERIDGETAIVEIFHNGMVWRPEYRYIEENGTQTVYASAAITNMSIQTWQADTLRFLAPDRSQVTAAIGRITVRQGVSRFPWWNAYAGRQQHIIRYGWPVPGKWNPLTAVVCPGKGRVESWTGRIFENGDTLFFPADSLLDISLDWEQGASDYQCFLTAKSHANQQMEWKVLWPETLPRGAEIEPGPDSFQIQPEQSVTLLYKEVY
ncbi:hypothetical protein CSA37_05715 [Candidatus Fermentibacteria bacterium]|nr:MAG: hypothetical protein CSA37_13185 [Candidatus Fermentibacteria bacterium]PIE52580.1 MAG: hypothetical protein CSA37_05715 [Candidatus Fermentibacteria bacterium]